MLMALVSVLVGPRVLTPHVVDGLASRVEPVPPPAVGDCLRERPGSVAVTGTGAFITTQPVSFVPCTDPHLGEVIYREEGLPDVEAGGEGGPVDSFRSRCVDRAELPWWPVTPTSSGWQSEVSIEVTVLGPDQFQFGDGQRWAACVAGAPDGELRQSLATMVGDRLPPEFGICTFGSGTTEEYTANVACTDEHATESFGFRRLAAGSDLDQAGLEASCRDVVATATGRTDLSAEPSLVIVAQASAWYAYGSGTDGTVTLPLPADAEGGYATCEVQAVDGRTLTASLRQIGDAPLPWAS